MKEKTWWSEVLFYGFLFVSIIAIIISQSGNKASDEDNKIVCVHIKGEVIAPGYYELEVGSRVKDAILMAGGETQAADLSGVNIARTLVDGEEIIIPATYGTDSENKNQLININTSDMYQLCKLDGIGESLATAIISYRIENGGFKTIEELKNVKGIGDSKFDAIKDKITVGESK